MSDSPNLSLSARIDASWTIFLDRDGVINRRLIDDYVKGVEDFDFLEGALEAIQVFTEKFRHVIVVTNQQGVAKGLMTNADIYTIHDHLQEEVAAAGGHIAGIYFCPDWAHAVPNCRKPNSNMALAAQKDFNDIDFSKSIMVGDMPSDIAFGANLGMTTIWLQGDKHIEYKGALQPDFIVASLREIASILAPIKNA